MRVRQLGELEAVVMDRLWTREEPALVRDVLEDLQPGRSLAYTTVMTVLENLYRKGFVRRAKDGRAYRYAATQSREAHTAELMGEVLSGSRDRGAALLHFVEQMPAEELADLRRALADLPPTTDSRDEPSARSGRETSS